MLKPVASKLTGKCVVLASASPRRRDILTNIGLKFEVVPSWYSEDLSKAEYPAPYAYATETAVRKALEVAKRMHERHQKTPDLVIGADTVVAIDGDILEKPADKPDAYRMLSRLSGREHSVFTGVALVECCVCEGKLQTSVVQFHEETRVKFAELSEELLWDYIDSGEPMDKAGGYGIQALGGMFVESIHGDFLNVVGLPLHHIFRKLGEHYIDEAATRALQVFATQQRREGELRALPRRLHILDENAFFNDGRVGKRERRLLSAGGCARQNELYFTLPSTRLFRDFFTHQIEHYSLAGAVTAGTVDAILPVLAAAGGGGGDGGGDGGPIVDYFQVTLKGGSTVRAHHVVLAAGPTRAAMAVVPDWVSSIGERFPEDRLLHTTEFISRAGGSVANVVSEPDEHVLVVGGGLSSAHMVLLAVEAGASSVTWVMRKHLQVKQFDVGDVETLVGRYAHREHGVRLDGLPFLRQFYAERGPRRRLDMIRQARKGGAVTPEAYGQIRPLIEAGIVSLRAYCQVESASWSYKEQRWRVVLSTGKETWSGDRIWLATGCKLDVAQDPLLANVLRHFPVPLVEGWPAIDDDLRWATGCELYLMGQYAALKVTNLCNWMAQVWTSIKVGPHAVNLAGGQAASARIAKAILQKHREEQQEDSSSRAQEFIDHMHGLMWC
ncbi:uncharacterized protein LOC116955684 isoform X5 [Petromyzon marinus]|uniref:uncharacterized protein LOC116955684 isoform X5 n=1 Tax=Petromyzon marinus TaxID=7757 RepID=UPI003F72615E